MINHNITKMQRNFQIVIVLSSVILMFALQWDVREKVRFKRQTEECEFDLCNATAGYPDELIAQIAAKQSLYTEMFGDVVGPHKIMKLSSRTSGSEIQEINMCSVRPLIVYPTKALDINREWRTIVNVKGYRQAVAFEACVNKTDCFAEGKLPLGYRTACEQQYITVRMIILDENEELKLAKFPVPSGCACVYFFDENY